MVHVLTAFHALSNGGQWQDLGPHLVDKWLFMYVLLAVQAVELSVSHHAYDLMYC